MVDFKANFPCKFNSVDRYNFYLYNVEEIILEWNLGGMSPNFRWHMKSRHCKHVLWDQEYATAGLSGALQECFTMLMYQFVWVYWSCLLQI